MENNKPSKLLVNEAEASQKIGKQINIGNELLKAQIHSQHEFDKLKSDTTKWINYNKTLFDHLFDKSPLPWTHGVANSYTYDRGLDIEIPGHRKKISQWINDLESIYEQLDIYTDLPSNTQQTMNRDTTNNENKTILICHGRSPIWREAKDFMVDILGLEYEEFERISAAGKSINNRLEEMLDKSCMAFLIMTGEEARADGLVHARQNVIHEIGKCQDRFGSERAIILLEKGCEKFSNIDGIIYIDFTKGNIKETFGEIVKVLIRESIIRIELCN